MYGFSRFLGNLISLYIRNVHFLVSTQIIFLSNLEIFSIRKDTRFSNCSFICRYKGLYSSKNFLSLNSSSHFRNSSVCGCNIVAESHKLKVASYLIAFTKV